MKNQHFSNTSKREKAGQQKSYKYKRKLNQKWNVEKYMEAVENIKLQEGQKNILRITSHVLYHKSVNQTNYNYALFIP